MSKKNPLAIGKALTGRHAEPRVWGELNDWVIWELGEGYGVTVYAVRDGLGRETKGHLQCSVRDLRVLAKLIPSFLKEHDEMKKEERADA